MTRRFRLILDEHIAKDVIQALRQGGWHVERVHEVLGHRTKDDVVFTYAASHQLVWLTSDQNALVLPIRWLREARAFTGMLVWTDELRRQMTAGEFIEYLVELEAENDPFAAGVRFVRPRRDLQ